jgi:hypothetical protein
MLTIGEHSAQPGKINAGPVPLNMGSQAELYIAEQLHGISE